MKNKKRAVLFASLCLIFLMSIGFEAGQNQSKSEPPAETVASPPEEIDPVRQELVEQLKYYRKIGDSAGASAILKLLDPSFTDISSEKPSDIIVTPGVEDPPGFRVEWRNPDIPVFNSGTHETHPVMDFIRSGAIYPTIIAACELWDGGSIDKISLKKSNDQGMTWTAGSYVYSQSGWRLGSPTIKQIGPTEIGMVVEQWGSASGPEVHFVKMTTNLEHRLTRYIDFGARKPYITSDFEDYADGYLYIVYYTIIYEPGVNPSLPYRYDLNFVKSDGFSWWSLPSLATFRSASGEVPIYCSIDYEDDTLYLAYIGESTRDIRVRRSIDFGSSWSSPTILKTGNVFEPEVAVGDSTHAIVMYTAGLYPDQDP